MSSECEYRRKYAYGPIGLSSQNATNVMVCGIACVGSLVVSLWIKIRHIRSRYIQHTLQNRILPCLHCVNDNLTIQRQIQTAYGYKQFDLCERNGIHQQRREFTSTFDVRRKGGVGRWLGMRNGMNKRDDYVNQNDRHSTKGLEFFLVGIRIFANQRSVKISAKFLQQMCDSMRPL